ncbi:MAG: GNAT family N-acetyltransferase [Actinomycetota bacterium]|nr:GNAT family N-acetyltransferase [Actinomycetota bacterium]
MGRAEFGSTQIRVAGVEDVAALAALRRRWKSRDDDPSFEQRFAKWLLDEGDRRTVWLAEADGAPIGMATLLEYRRMPLPGHPGTAWGYLGSMFVLTSHRGRGVGARLVDAVLAVADARDYVRVVLSPSPRSLPFYRRAGFAEADGKDGDRLLVRRRPQV